MTNSLSLFKFTFTIIMISVSKKTNTRNTNKWPVFSWSRHSLKFLWNPRHSLLQSSRFYLCGKCEPIFADSGNPSCSFPSSSRKERAGDLVYAVLWQRTLSGFIGSTNSSVNNQRKKITGGIRIKNNSRMQQKRKREKTKSGSTTQLSKVKRHLMGRSKSFTFHGHGWPAGWPDF